MLWDNHHQNISLVHLYTHSDRGIDVTLVAFAMMTWINSRMMFQAAEKASVYFLVTLSLSVFFPTILFLSLPYSSPSLSESYNVSVWCFDILMVKVLMISVAEAWPSRMTTSVCNGESRKAFIVTQLQIFFDQARSPEVEWRRTSMTGMCIWSPVLIWSIAKWKIAYVHLNPVADYIHMLN